MKYLQVYHEMDVYCPNGGRAEPTKEAFESISFVAHVLLSWSHISLRVDVPSIQRR